MITTLSLCAVLVAPDAERRYGGPLAAETPAPVTDDLEVLAPTAEPRAPPRRETTTARDASASTTAPPERAAPPEPKPDVFIPSDGALVRADAEDDALIMPTMLAEVDVRTLADEVEGYDGFGLGRFRMGMRAQPRPWVGAVGTVEFLNDEHQTPLVDGLIVFQPTKWMALTLGYAKAPLFASFRQEPVHAMALPERSPVVTQMHVRRDVGAEMQLRPRRAPIEAIVRIGNGTSSIRSNDNRTPTGYAALDLVLGRAWVGGRNRVLGLRVGGAAMLEDSPEKDGISGATPWNFTYWRPTPVIGRRVVAEGHVVAYVGPVRLIIEGAVASEARARDDDGNAETPRATQDDSVTWGATAELAWVIRGMPREVGRAPQAKPRSDGRWNGGALEVAGRFDRLSLGRNADDVTNGGATGGAVATRWWPVDFLSVALEGNVLRYDDAPVESPERTLSWLALLRTSVFFGYPGQSRPIMQRVEKAVRARRGERVVAR